MTEVLDEFCNEKGEFFLGLPKLMQKLDVKQYGDNTYQSVIHANHFAFELIPPHNKVTFHNCVLIQDAGASFRLTPFHSDFVDYIECQLPVKNISKTNMVIGIGTTLQKFMVNDEPIWLPCLSYHLTSVKFCLFSPETYHTLYGDHSVVMGDNIYMFVGNHWISANID